MSAPGVPGSVNWVPLGPSVISREFSGIYPNCGGRVVDLAVGPGGARAYAASAYGGPWFTPDGGATWAPINDYATVPTYALAGTDINSTVLGSIAVKFGATAALDYVFVGTGMGTGGVGIMSSPSGGSAGSWVPEAINLL